MGSGSRWTHVAVLSRGATIAIRIHLGGWPRRSGGIGRRAGLRCQCPLGRGGSSPPSDTTANPRCDRESGSAASSTSIRWALEIQPSTSEISQLTSCFGRCSGVIPSKSDGGRRASCCSLIPQGNWVVRSGGREPCFACRSCTDSACVGRTWCRPCCASRPGGVTAHVRCSQTDACGATDCRLSPCCPVEERRHAPAGMRA